MINPKYFLFKLNNKTNKIKLITKGKTKKEINNNTNCKLMLVYQKWCNTKKANHLLVLLHFQQRKYYLGYNYCYSLD